MLCNLCCLRARSRLRARYYRRQSSLNLVSSQHKLHDIFRMAHWKPEWHILLTTVSVRAPLSSIQIAILPAWVPGLRCQLSPGSFRLKCLVLVLPIVSFVKIQQEFFNVIYTASVGSITCGCFLEKI